jgi:hypothetical protein
MRTKIAVSVTLLLSLSAVAFGQTQVQCRPLQPNDFVGPDESIVGSGNNAMVCHSVVVANVQPAPSPKALVASPATPPPAAAIGGSIGSKVSLPVQFSVGYEYDSVNFSGYGYSTSRTNTNGFFLQGIGNLSRHFAVVGNFDGIYKKIPFTIDGPSGPVQSPHDTNYLLTYTGGIQLNPLGHRDLIPFVRGTFGAGTVHLVFPNTVCGAICLVAAQQITNTGFAWQIGGGFDYRLKPEGRLALRLGQFDYSQMRKNGVAINSLKIGAGLTF